MSEPVVVTCQSACTVTHVITAGGYSEELLQADLIVYGACLGFLAVVWAVRQVYNIFHNGRSE